MKVYRPLRIIIDLQLPCCVFGSFLGSENQPALSLVFNMFQIQCLSDVQVMAILSLASSTEKENGKQNGVQPTVLTCLDGFDRGER